MICGHYLLVTLAADAPRLSILTPLAPGVDKWVPWRALSRQSWWHPMNPNCVGGSELLLGLERAGGIHLHKTLNKTSRQPGAQYRDSAAF